MLSASVRNDFPILDQEVQPGKKLVYLDSAATTQKPKQVLDAIQQYYLTANANVHRGVHTLGDRSTRAFMQAREVIAKFFGADPNELILVRNTTEALNWIGPMWAKTRLGPGKAILTTQMEHHSNLVPWQMLCKQTGAELRVAGVLPDGTLDLADFKKKLTPDVVLVAVTHVSNALGTLNPISELVELAHKVGAVLVVDGAQSASHLPINFDQLGADFYAFSGHKMLGPMGIGGLLVRREVLADCQPVLFGGGMIAEVSDQETTFAELPDRFIPGTPDVASTVGLAAACAYLTKLGMRAVQQHDQQLVEYALDNLCKTTQIQLIGPLHKEKRVGSISFLYPGVHAHDVAQVLDAEGVAVRSGHHCTMPLHTHFGWAATTRASFSVYTSTQDIDALVNALRKVATVFRVGR